MNLKQELYNLAKNRFIMAFECGDKRAMIIANNMSFYDVSNYTEEQVKALAVEQHKAHEQGYKLFTEVDQYSNDGVTFMSTWAEHEPYREIDVSYLINQRPQVIAEMIKVIDDERRLIHDSLLKEYNS